MNAGERLRAALREELDAQGLMGSYYAPHLVAAVLPEVEKICREAVREEREATLEHIARFPGTINLYDDIGRGMHRMQREEDPRE